MGCCALRPERTHSRYHRQESDWSAVGALPVPVNRNVTVTAATGVEPPVVDLAFVKHKVRTP